MDDGPRPQEQARAQACPCGAQAQPRRASSGARSSSQGEGSGASERSQDREEGQAGQAPPSLRRGARGGPALLLYNRSGYDTEDLRRFFVRGLRALHVKERKSIIVVAAPARSRGCAEVGGGREGEAIVIAIAPPSRFHLRRLARLFEHEVGHTSGLAHDDMEYDMLWSLGQTPAWAAGAKIHYRGRAQSQIP